MRRKLLIIAAALSVLLGVVTGALWVRSYWVWDTLAHADNWHPDPSGNGEVLRASLLMHADGQITFESFWDWTANAPLYQQMPGWSYGRSTMRLPPRPPRTRSMWNRLGFSLVRDDAVFPPASGREWHRVDWTVPYWCPTLLIFVCAYVLARPVLAHHRAARHRAAGRCGHCGYDLRASPERCPECGTSAYAAISAASSVQTTP
jgi:hypothetical protein